MTATLLPASLNAPAPSFDLDSSQGRVRLEQFRGQRVVLFFMREFNCPVCLGHVRELKRLAAQHPGVQFLVAGGGSAQQAHALARRSGLPFPVLADPDHVAYARYDLGKALGLMQRSGTAVIDPAGVLRLFIGSYNPLASFTAREVERALAEL